MRFRLSRSDVVDSIAPRALADEGRLAASAERSRR
jgi:hypothetical protein